jgi:hypothetical protein
MNKILIAAGLLALTSAPVLAQTVVVEPAPPPPPPSSTVIVTEPAPPPPPVTECRTETRTEDKLIGSETKTTKECATVVPQ